MSVVEVEVDVECLSSDPIDEHLRTSTRVLQEIFQSDQEGASVAAEAGGNVCTRCGKLYKTKSTLRSHSLLKHPPVGIEVRCVTCDKQYASLLSLQKHVRYMHRYEHRCKACYRSFATAPQLEAHGDTCPKAERPCPTCGKMYDSRLSLKNHIKYKHPIERTNWCEICRRAFTSMRGLANHFAAIHPDGMNCVQCDKKFNSVLSLQRHLLCKHSEKGEKCNFCKKVFTCKRNLGRHVARKHEGREGQEGGRYSCGVCTARFHSSQAIIRHMMESHTDKKTD